MLVTKRSGFTGNLNTREIDITPAMLVRIENRSIPMQLMVPNMSADDREFLITGSTPEEWAEGLPEVEDDYACSLDEDPALVSGQDHSQAVLRDLKHRRSDLLRAL